MPKSNRRLGNNPLESRKFDFIRDTRGERHMQAELGLRLSVDGVLCVEQMAIRASSHETAEFCCRLFLVFLGGEARFDVVRQPLDDQVQLLILAREPELGSATRFAGFGWDAAEGRWIWRLELGSALRSMLPEHSPCLTVTLHHDLSELQSNGDASESGFVRWHRTAAQLSEGTLLWIQAPAWKPAQDNDAKPRVGECPAPRPKPDAEVNPVAVESAYPVERKVVSGDVIRDRLSESQQKDLRVPAEPGREYRLWFFDGCNAASFNKDCTLPEIAFRVLRADGESGYPETAYQRYQSGWGLASRDRRPSIRLRALDDALVIRVAGYRLASQGSFELNVEQGSDRALETGKTHAMELVPREIRWASFLVSQGKSYELFLYDEFNGEAFGHDFDLPALAFRLYRPGRLEPYPESAYVECGSGWGLVPKAAIPAAVFSAQDDEVSIEIEGYRAAYRGRFGVRLDPKG